MYPTLSFDDGGDYPSFEDVVSNSSISKNAKIIMYIYYFEKWIVPMGLCRDEFDSKYGSCEAIKNYKNLIENLHNFLQCESNELPKRINIFTTNYDLAFERTFDKILMEKPLIYFNDGSRGVFRKYISNKNFYLNVTHSGYNDNYRREVPTINLFKLHGSLSWKIEEDKILVNENNPDIASIGKIVNEIGIDLETIDDLITGSKSKNIGDFINNLNHRVVGLDLTDKKLDEFFSEYRKLPIINPDKYKFFATVSEQHYYQLIRSFSYELERKQTTLIVFGFSFADEHIKDIFERSLLNPELQVIMISYSKDGQDVLRSMFGGYKNITFLPDDFSREKGDFNFLLSLLGDSDE
jgi:hypothetical protein